MTEERSIDDYIDIGSLFRNSGTITFVIQIISFIVMIGSLAAFFIGGFLPSIPDNIKILLLLGGIVITLLVFLAAIGVFIRFSRRISNFVIGPGIERVRMDSPRIKAVVYTLALLIVTITVFGVYSWYLIHMTYLIPLAEQYNSISLLIFGYALGAFFIALLIQIIIAGVGRGATKLILEVLDADDSEFLEP